MRDLPLHRFVVAVLCGFSSVVLAQQPSQATPLWQNQAQRLEQSLTAGAAGPSAPAGTNGMGLQRFATTPPGTARSQLQSRAQQLRQMFGGETTSPQNPVEGATAGATTSPLDLGGTEATPVVPTLPVPPNVAGGINPWAPNASVAGVGEAVPGVGSPYTSTGVAQGITPYPNPYRLK